MNVFATVGEIIASDTKGKSKILTIRFGKQKPLDPEARVQFLPCTRVRVPMPLVERLQKTIPEALERGNVVSIQGYFQGVLTRDDVTGSASMINELVASNITPTGIEMDYDEAMRRAESKGASRLFDALLEDARKEGEQETSEEDIRQPEQVDQ